MRITVRLKLEMVTRARDFNLAHPSDDPSFVATLARLGERRDNADTLVTKERDGLIRERTAVERRDELRRVLHYQLLRHLVRAGEQAAKEEPGLIGKFRLRAVEATHTQYLVSAKAMLRDGVANRDLLVKCGLSAAMLEDLGEVVGQYEAAIAEVSAGRQDHMGARVELEKVTAELMELVELLNTFNRYRFRDDSELTTAWESARYVRGPFGVRGKRSSAEGGETPLSGGAPPA